MKLITLATIAAAALTLSSCTPAATPSAAPPAASTPAAAATQTTTAPALLLKAACEEASTIIGDLDDVPEADEYAAAADNMYDLVERGDRDTKEVFQPVETALKALSTASPGEEYLAADKDLLDSLDAANEKCLAVGSDAFN